MWPNPQETADLAAFTEDNGKLHFICSEHPFGENTWFWKRTQLMLLTNFIPNTNGQLVSEGRIERFSWKFLFLNFRNIVRDNLDSGPNINVFKLRQIVRYKQCYFGQSEFQTRHQTNFFFKKGQDINSLCGF